MHEGKLSRAELQAWTLNRYYYQTRIPIKDASSSPSPRTRPSAGPGSGGFTITTAGAREGGLALWLRLAEAVGLDRDEVASCRRVLPGVRFACDAYVALCARARWWWRWPRR